MTANAAPARSPRQAIPSIPRPLQRVFDAVPLLTYPANALPYRSPAPPDRDSALPILHVFTTPRDAARGWPSFNPSCLKWQTYLRLCAIPHTLTPSTNHASPTGALPFLLPALPARPDQRLDTRPLLPVPSSRLAHYAAQRRPSPQTQAQPSPPPAAAARTQQAYQALLDTPIRNAWLYALYLLPDNEPLLHTLYLAPVSRSSLVQRTTLLQLRRAARSEIAKTTTTPTPTHTTSDKSWLAYLSGDHGMLTDKLLTWAALGGQPTVDPDILYADAKKAWEALEAALSKTSSSPSEEEEEEEGGVSWFFNSPQATLFDAAVFSYTYLILAPSCFSPSEQDGNSRASSWGDNTLPAMLRENCPKIVAHTRRIIKEYWADVEGLRV